MSGQPFPAQTPAPRALRRRPVRDGTGHAGPAGAWRRARGALPAGRTLPAGHWEGRHAWMVGAMWAQALVLLAWGALQGGPVAAAAAVAPIALCGSVAGTARPRMVREGAAAAGLPGCTRSFVRGGVGDDHDAAIVEGVIGLAHSLGPTVAAEGVETDEQATRRRDWGCERGLVEPSC